MSPGPTDARARAGYYTYILDTYSMRARARACDARACPRAMTTTRVGGDRGVQRHTLPNSTPPSALLDPMLASALVLLLMVLLTHGAHAKCYMTSALGCFVDNQPGRVLTGLALLGQEGDGMDLDHCAQLCQDKKFTLAGVEEGHQCFWYVCCRCRLPSGTSCAYVQLRSLPAAVLCSGDKLNSHQPSTGCTSTCPSNSSETCGGSDAIQIFKFACAGPPSPPLPHGPPPPPPPPPTPSSPNLCPDFDREYCKPNVPLDERIEMVMSYMSIEDKMKTMAEQGITGKYKDGTNLAARSVSWWNEALHGVCRGCGDNGNKCPTQFPEANAMSASFNATLWHMIGDTISTEGRGEQMLTRDLCALLLGYFMVMLLRCVQMCLQPSTMSAA